MHRLISAAWLAVVLLAPGTALAADQTIYDFEAMQQTAWNAHDVTAYAAALDQTVDMVTALGWHWHGQAEAARNLGQGFQFVYAHAQLAISDVQVRTLAPALVAVTLRWSIDGARTLDSGSPAGEQHGWESQIVQRRPEGWRILSQQDTAAIAPFSAADTAVQAGAAASLREIGPAQTFPVAPPPARRCVLARAKGQCLIYGKAKQAPAS